jgi:hypothetical protein
VTCLQYVIFLPLCYLFFSLSSAASFDRLFSPPHDTLLYRSFCADLHFLDALSDLLRAFWRIRATKREEEDEGTDVEEMLVK